MENEILREDDTCWRKARADRGAMIIGGENYFRALREAILKAEKHVFILSWEVHTGVRLLRDEDPDDGFPIELGPFIDAVLDAKPNLHIHLLLWDFSFIYVGEREWPSFADLLKNAHPRLHFELDDAMSYGASHHQKIVVIDDALAFTGGMDVSVWRWDTNENLADDSRRFDPNGEPYQPYHDAQFALTGPAAKALGDVCAYRWKRATDRELPRSESPLEPAPWPDSVEVDFEEMDVGFARTYSEFEPYPEVFEAERFHLEVIKKAEHYIYFENQFYSSQRINEALIERLGEPDGPEILIAMNHSAGWMEKSTLGLLRDRLFEKLSQSDKHRRLRLFYPAVTDGDGEETPIYLHAKLIIADDRLVKIGSTNLTNRSMRVDSEIDTILECDAPCDPVRHFRNRLLGVHFAKTPEEICKHLDQYESLAKALDALLTDKGHSLRPPSFGVKSVLKRKLADSQLLDPEEPIDPAFWIRRAVPNDVRSLAKRRIWLVVGIVILALAIALIIKFGLGDYANKETVENWLESIRGETWAPFVLIAAFFIAGLAGFPVNLILIAAAAVLGPWIALLCGIVGSHISALAGFGLGRWIGKPLVAKFESSKVDRLNEMLQQRGILSVIMIRLIPVAPYVVVNLVAGASKLRFGVFNLGTILAITPGMAAVVWLTRSVGSVISNPGWSTILSLVGAVALIVGVAFFIRKSLQTRKSA